MSIPQNYRPINVKNMVNIPLPLIKFLTKKGYKVVDARVKYSSVKDIQLITVISEDIADSFSLEEK